MTVLLAVVEMDNEGYGTRAAACSCRHGRHSPRRHDLSVTHRLTPLTRFRREVPERVSSLASSSEHADAVTARTEKSRVRT